jgi:hypothetical protein
MSTQSVSHIKCCSSDMLPYAFPVVIVFLVCFLPCLCCYCCGWICSQCCSNRGAFHGHGTYLTSTTSATSTTCTAASGNPLPNTLTSTPLAMEQTTSATQYIPEATPIITDIPEAVVISVMPQPSAPPLPVAYPASYGSTKNNF